MGMFLDAIGPWRDLEEEKETSNILRSIIGETEERLRNANADRIGLLERIGDLREKLSRASLSTFDAGAEIKCLTVDNRRLVDAVALADTKAKEATKHFESRLTTLVETVQRTEKDNDLKAQEIEKLERYRRGDAREIATLYKSNRSLAASSEARDKTIEEMSKGKDYLMSKLIETNRRYAKAERDLRPLEDKATAQLLVSSALRNDKKALDKRIAELSETFRRMTWKMGQYEDVQRTDQMFIGELQGDIRKLASELKDAKANTIYQKNLVAAEVAKAASDQAALNKIMATQVKRWTDPPIFINEAKPLASPFSKTKGYTPAADKLDKIAKIIKE